MILDDGTLLLMNSPLRLDVLPSGDVVVVVIEHQGKFECV